MTNTLMYQSGVFYNQPVDGRKVLIPHQRDPVAPEIGDQVAIGRHYAARQGGVTLNASGNIIALNEPRG